MGDLHELKSNSQELSLDLTLSMRAMEKKIILATLEKFHFNRTHTARSLGIGIRTLQRKINEYSSEEKSPELHLAV